MDASASAPAQGMRSPTSPPAGYALPTPPDRPSPPSSYTPPAGQGRHGSPHGPGSSAGAGPAQPPRVSSRLQLGRRPSGLTSNLASPISPTSTAGAGGFRWPPGMGPGQGRTEGGPPISPLSARAGGGAPPPLPPGAAPSSSSFAPPTPTKTHRRRASQDRVPQQQQAYQAMPQPGSEHSMATSSQLPHAGQGARPGDDLMAPRSTKPAMDFGAIAPPSIPQLPASPSLDMAYFTGHTSAPNGSAPPAQPSYFAAGPPMPTHTSREARLASLAAAGGVGTLPPGMERASSEGTHEGDDDVFDSQTTGTAMTSVSSIASTASSVGQGPNARPEPNRKDTLSPPMPGSHQGSRSNSPARSSPSALGVGYDAKLLPPRGPPSRSVSSSVVSTSSSQGSGGSGGGGGGARMDIIASSTAGKLSGKRNLPAPPPQTVRKSPSREMRAVRAAPQPRSMSAGALYHQSQHPTAPPVFPNLPRQPSPLSGGPQRADGSQRRASPPPRQQQGGGRLTNRDLPPILTPKASAYSGSQQQPYLPHGPANGRASPIDRRSSSSPLAGPPRSASLAASTANQGRILSRGPPSTSANGSYMNRQPSATSQDYPLTPTSAAVDSIIEEMLHSSQEGSMSPRSPRTVTRHDSVDSENGSVLDRPRPSKKSSEYTIRPGSTGRSPTPQQGGFPRQVSGSQQRYMGGGSRGKRAALLDAITQEPIQQALFPHLSIASFLALLGSLPAGAHRMVSGEIVGRWVCREWHVTVSERETWPGLQVWEGFLESLLHNPTAFSTYPAHFQPLLQHLSLSHTLIVLFLRSLPAGAFPDAAPFPWEDEGTSTAIGLPNSQSAMTLSSFAARSRAMSGINQDHPRPPKAERVIELVMPEPLGIAKPEDDVVAIQLSNPPQPKVPVRQRRGSLGSASLVSWRHKERRGSESTASSSFANSQSSTLLTAPSNSSRKAPLPPVSFPKAKRYVFRNHPDEASYSSHRSRTSSESGRPGSVFSVDDTLSLSGAPPMPQINRSLYRQRRAPSESGSSNFRSSAGRHSPSFGSNLRYGSNALGSRTATSSPTASRFFRNDFTPPSGPVEPAFDKPLPMVQGRVPVLRIFVPLSEQVRSWPCLEGAKRARAELERAGAWTKLKVGDIIINTALQDPLLPRHLMLYSPAMQPFLVPLEYRYSADGHLPGYIDAFVFPPSYYFPLLPAPYIVYLDLSPFAERALPTLRLAFDRRDVTTARGDKVVAKRYLQVAGFQITPADSFVCEDWEGMITLEADGTAEGRNEILQRLGRSPAMQTVRPVIGAWEIVREKSLGGSVWLRLCQEASTPA